jgi:hypothetical protein
VQPTICWLLNVALRKHEVRADIESTPEIATFVLHSSPRPPDLGCNRYTRHAAD